MSGAGEAFDERDMQAAEYVLGVLPANQARALEALAMSDAAMAAQVAAWENRLAPLADVVPPISPPAILWRRLALATGLESVVAGPPAARRGGAGRVWRSAGAWRALTVASMAVAASMGFLLYTGGGWAGWGAGAVDGGARAGEFAGRDVPGAGGGGRVGDGSGDRGDQRAAGAVSGVVGGGGGGSGAGEPWFIAGEWAGADRAEASGGHATVGQPGAGGGVANEAADVDADLCRENLSGFERER